MSQLNGPIWDGDQPEAEGEQTPDAYLMDPAQQSLADALRITYRVLILIMFVLAGLFALSGLKTVPESQRGVVLRFGKVTNDNVPPGFVFTWPFPIGELQTVPIGQQTTYVDQAFMTSDAARRRAGEERAPANRFQLNPARDGSMITGDLAIAHATLTVLWRRNDPQQWIRGMQPDGEEAIVRAAVQRGVVRAVATTEIDEFLKQRGAASGQGEGGRLALRVLSVAQETLDAMNSGIRIEQINFDGRYPPARTNAAFTSVTGAENRAATARERADRAARQTLNAAAGEAHVALLDLIDEYERAVELEEPERAATLLERINAILEGERVDVNGRMVAASGVVTAIINDAKQYRTDIVSRMRSRADSFAVRLRQFRENAPEVFVAREWQAAYADFRESSGVETMLVPPGAAPISIWLNRDPEIQRELEEARNRLEAELNLERIDEQRVERFMQERREARQREQQ